ncbi:hypothetical protein GTZ99_09485 [Novosphingobium sp. FSY-8]|uniref:Uncharacterized protein n=1 Tax=Novosphingobium ovatum TaxID=1908523 RepID=A0ABW9XE50_9SPHN|nr:hypothetical protein [Novosphingobium ovatum]NBC36787.1 hypothetical protein [Novosphingobium ovatum]
MNGVIKALTMGVALSAAAWGEVAQAEKSDRPEPAKAIEASAMAAGGYKFKPERGYILMSAHSRVGFGTFLRLPDARDWKAYEADLQKALVRAQKAYPSLVSQWQFDTQLAKDNHKPLPPKPVEPTLADVSAERPETRNMATLGPMFVFAKDKDRFNYLSEVEPGTYVFFGMLSQVEQLPSVCMCMGTVSFTVKAGEVTDLGNMLERLPQLPEKPTAGMGSAAMQAKLWAKQRERSQMGELWGAPGLPADWRVTRAELFAYGKMNNLTGALIDRVAPIPGILAYRHDTVIDARTGQDVPSPTIMTRAKLKH